MLFVHCAGCKFPVRFGGVQRSISWPTSSLLMSVFRTFISSTFFFFFANFSIKLFYKPRRLEHLGTNQFCNMSYQRNACHSDIFLKFSHELIFQNAMLIIGQAVGACWFLLGVQRATKCLKLQCYQSQTCGPKTLACVNPIYYGTSPVKLGGGRLDWAHNIQARNTCLSSSDHFQYGAYKWTVNLVTNPNREEKILLPIFWGLMTLR